jgi:hypothetical protein
MNASTVAGITVCFAAVLCVSAPVSAQQEWGFGTENGQYVQLQRQLDGTISGTVLSTDANGGFVSAPVFGSNTSAGQLSLSVPDLLGDGDVSFQRRVIGGNTAWVTNDPAAQVELGALVGVTQRNDPLADDFLQDWRGDAEYLLPIDSYANLIALSNQYLGDTSLSQADVGIVATRSSAAFWETVALASNDTASVRTIDADVALITTTTAVVSGAVTNDVTRPLATQASSIGTGPMVAALFLRKLSVPKESIFDRIAEARPLRDLEDELNEILDEISEVGGCKLERVDTTQGIIICEYHSTEVGISEGFWLRTGIGFTLQDSATGRDVWWHSKSWYAVRSIGVRPKDDEFEEVVDSNPAVSRAPASMIEKFLKLIQLQFNGTVIVR